MRVRFASFPRFSRLCRSFGSRTRLMAMCLTTAMFSGPCPGGRLGLRASRSPPPRCTMVSAILVCVGGQKAARKVDAVLAPPLDLDEILHAAERRTEHHAQDLLKRVQHPPRLARVLQRRKMIEKRRGRLGPGHRKASQINEASHDHATGPMKNPFRQKPTLT